MCSSSNLRPRRRSLQIPRPRHPSQRVGPRRTNIRALSPSKKTAMTSSLRRAMQRGTRRSTRAAKTPSVPSATRLSPAKTTWSSIAARTREDAVHQRPHLSEARKRPLPEHSVRSSRQRRHPRPFFRQLLSTRLYPSALPAHSLASHCSLPSCNQPTSRISSSTSRSAPIRILPRTPWLATTTLRHHPAITLALMCWLRPRATHAGSRNLLFSSLFLSLAGLQRGASGVQKAPSSRRIDACRHGYDCENNGVYDFSFYCTSLSPTVTLLRYISSALFARLGLHGYPALRGICDEILFQGRRGDSLELQ